MIDVILENVSDCRDIPALEQFNAWVSLAVESTTATGVVSILIVNPDESQALNLQFRQQDKPTNVLSFPFEPFEGIEDNTNQLGDIAICAAIVNQEAAEQHKDVTAHWAHLTIHGTLHLLGYDHQTDDEANEMEQLETTLLQQLGYPNPYE